MSQEPVNTVWGLNVTPYGCPHCGQVHLLPPDSAGAVCPHCAAEGLQPQPAALRPEAPEKVLPFQVQTDGLRTVFEQFVHGVWLRYDDFNVETLSRRARPVFLPMWLVDSDLRGDWRAEMGFDYQVKSSQESYDGGDWHTRERIEGRVRWAPRAGQVQRHYDNTAVPALSDHARVMARTGRYNLQNAQGYNPESLAGLSASIGLRAPDQDTEQAWPQARDGLEKRLAQDCQQAAGAQHLRRFTCRLAYENRNWTQLLLPMYVSWYSDDEGRRYPVVVNGQSGQVGGVRMASQRKGWQWAGILAAVAIITFLLALLGFALTAAFPPAAAIGTVLAVIALVLGVAALVPAVWPWQWNRRQQDETVFTDSGSP